MSRRALIAVVVTFLAVTLLLAFHAADPLELPLRDLALRALPSRPAAHTVIVAIDEPSLRTFGRWPWPRALLARIVEHAARAGARAVVLDTLLAEASEGDAELGTAMRRVPTISIAAVAEPDQWLLIAPKLRDAALSAHGNFEIDRDGIVRRFASTKQNGNRSLTALAIEAAAIVTSAPVPVGQAVRPAFRTRPEAIPVIGAAEFLRSSGAIAARKLVFFGPTALALGDRVLTPVSRDLDPGVTVHAAASESVIRGEVLRELSPLAAGILAAFAVAAIVMARRRRVLAVVLVATVVAAGMTILATNNFAVPFATLSSTVILATLAMEASAMARSVRESRQSLEELATSLAERRAHELESKRLLAHELKTPLASMRGLTQLLSGYELTETERRRVSSLLEAEAGKLQSMVTGLLDLERLPLRDFAGSTDVVDLGEIVSRRVEFLQASTDRKLEAVISDDAIVRADSSLLESVVDNLVGNALKYAPGASPVTIRVRRDANGVALEVEDRGPGIAATDHERVFQRFVRGSSATGTDGLGLGLSLVAEVAQWHGGSVSVDSTEGSGARFRVTLPESL